MNENNFDNNDYNKPIQPDIDECFDKSEEGIIEDVTTAEIDVPATEDMDNEDVSSEEDIDMSGIAESGNFVPNFTLVTPSDEETFEEGEASGEDSTDVILQKKLSEYEYDRTEVFDNEESASKADEEEMPVQETEEVKTESTKEAEEEKYDPRFSKPPKKERKKKSRTENGTRVSRGILLVVCCLVFSLIGSYIGGYYGMYNAIRNSGGTVLYQSVQLTDDDGEYITSPLSVESTAELVKHSVVEITTETVQESWFIQQYVTEGAGSGVIISEDGYIVTNNHVIEGVSSIKVRTIDGTEYTAKLIGTDSKTDLAVIKIEAQDLKAAVFGSSGSLKVGQSVIAVGNPLGELGGTVTDGIISALEREMTIEGARMNLLQTNAAVNPGNSGGGLFNLYGELVGIVNAKTSGSGIEGLGFAIPIDDARDVIEELIDLGYVSGRAYMGVTLIDINDYMTAASYRVNRYGVYILEVETGSPADNAGLRAGDYVEGIDDELISRSDALVQYIATKSVGDTVTMYIERNGQGMDISVTLAEYIPASNIN